jgi:GNAT superfamily N-acetyltransferase
MTTADLDEVVAIHLMAFPDNFISRLGRPFLLEFYREALAEIALVAVLDRRVVGTQLTFTQPGGTFLRMLMRRGAQFARAAAPTALQGPWQAFKVSMALFKPLQARRRQGEAIAMYTAVDPCVRGKGVARLLLKRMIAETDLAGVTSIHGENEDDPRLMRLYESVGFHKVGTLAQGLNGRPMIETAMNIKVALADLAGDPDFLSAVHDALRARVRPLPSPADGRAYGASYAVRGRKSRAPQDSG